LLKIDYHLKNSINTQRKEHRISKENKISKQEKKDKLMMQKLGEGMEKE
jgi:hypothetical protein